MKKHIITILFYCLGMIINAQQPVPLGKGSYAEYPPEAVAYDDGYFAHPYKWFELAWPDINLHDNARNKPMPTNKWWTEFLFRGLGRIQAEYHVGPVTVTTTGNRFGCEAWAYPHMVTASAEGFNVYFPKGFNGGGMNKGNPLKINATSVLQANDENVLFADFETAAWPQGWVVSNNTENIPGPMATSEITQSPKPNGYVGDRFVNTYKGDGARITLTSPQFTIEKNYIRLYAGGGNYPNETYVGLFIDGQKVRNATGENSGNLKQHTWNVAEYKGQQAEIRIVDNSGGGWGFIMCDEIIFTDSEFGGAGYTPDFNTYSTKVYDWSDLGFTLRSENNGKMMDATMVHGVPFTYVELDGLYPLLVPGGTVAAYDVNGSKVEDFPATMNAFTIEFDNRVYGVHVPTGSTIHQSKGGDFQVEIPSGKKRYVVVSALPDRSFLKTYDDYARNKPGDARFDFEYKVSEGKIVTTFNMNAKDLDTGATAQPTLMSFLPHHYRTTTKDFDFISGADYHMFIGQMHTAAGSSFSLSYNFGGMPPYLPEPLGLSDERKQMLNDLLDYTSQHYTINGNTYAKGLGENGTLMLMAKSMDNAGFELFRNNLKSELTDWFTFSESERTQKQRYFAEYPEYGAVIGFPPGYGSQGFNDLHFHNGYFTVGSARLMMVDKEFKRDFAEMAKLVTKTFANWERYEGAGDTYMPFLRTFDPYLGHSFTGGTGDGGGNNQESTSEAINSWFGLYLMGVELNDKAMIDAGAMGYMLETIATGEYWLDLYGDNFSPTYEHGYVGILRTDNLAWATYFAGDPAWVLGIQACPSDFFYTGFALNPEKMTAINAEMFHDRTTFIYDGNPMHTNDDPYDNIKTMGPYLGGYHLNIMNYIDPVNSSQWVDDFCRQTGTAGQEWRNHPNTATNYFLSNAMITYGNPAAGYHTSIPSGAVYQNEAGELTYLLYNATSEDVDVNIYKDGAIIETITVAAGKYYNSRIVGGQKPNVTITTYKENDKMALNKKVKIAASATDKDGSVLWVDFYFDGEKIGTAYAEPFEVSFTPTESGTKELKAIAVDNDGNESEPHIVTMEVLTTEQTPYRGTPWKVPTDKILAVQFDNGGPEISCHDRELEMEGGNSFRLDTGVETENSNNGDGNIGWSQDGEWLEYTIQVEQTGVYAMYSKHGSAGGGTMQIDIDGDDVTGNVAFATTGAWGNYQDVFIANIPLKEGKHIMRVTMVKRGANLSSFKFTLLADDMPSEVNAGEDKIILYPENAVTLAAVATTYGTATVTKYEWKQTDSNTPANITSPNQATTQVAGLALGTYIFEVTITDSNGAIATDQVVVLVRPGNFPPVAHPGESRTIIAGEELKLDGSLSTDPDGTIVKYEWKQIDNNSPVQINQASETSPEAVVTGYQGDRMYIFQLTVTDNQGAASSENVRIYINGSTDIKNVADKSVVVYPNPFADQIIITNTGSKNLKMAKLYAVTGDLLMEKDMKGLNIAYLDTSGLKGGYYLLTIHSEDDVVSYKMIKK